MGEHRQTWVDLLLEPDRLAEAAARYNPNLPGAIPADTLLYFLNQAGCSEGLSSEVVGQIARQYARIYDLIHAVSPAPNSTSTCLRPPR